jgi:hypothetical protein
MSNTANNPAIFFIFVLLSSSQRLQSVMMLLALRDWMPGSSGRNYFSKPLEAKPPSMETPGAWQ